MVRDGLYPAAIDFLTESVQTYPLSEVILGAIGRVYQLNSQPAEAVPFLKKSLEIMQRKDTQADDRPYINCRFDQLREEFRVNTKDPRVLKLLLGELGHRNKNRDTSSLTKEVQKTIAACESSNTRGTQINKKCVSETNEQIQPVGSGARVPGPGNWDAEQKMVIELDEDDTRIVEAGPGAGKTAVACARVAYLIEECDLEASKIFLISFTRTAVKELRDRIEAFATDPVNVAGLQMFTLDSFTWQVLRGLGDDESADLMGSYETNINQFIEQLKSGDAQLLDYLEEFEHVVLDEGQDLVGDRAELAIQIISNLEEGCGVTVFADSAQAIYGFTDDSGQHGTHQSLTVVERIMQGEPGGFDRIKLINVHRTDDPKLKYLFQTGREELLDKKESDINGWRSMKQLITECAHGEVGLVKDQDLSGKSDHLVLFRTRAEVLQASSYLWSSGIAHKLRMSGIQQLVHPWIGRMFGEYVEDYMDSDQFDYLWEEKIGTENSEDDPDPDIAWQLLLENVGDKDDRVRVVRLREILSRDRPPIDFLIDEKQLPGPILGTIHASKGREANQVNLMLPPDDFINEDESSPYWTSPRETAEEERVLFVGATRAKNRLMVGKGHKMYSSRLDSGRTHKKTIKPGRQQIEIGLAGDIDFLGMADGRLGNDPNEIQNWLWENAVNNIGVSARYNLELGTYLLYVEASDMPIGVFSKKFGSDLWSIANIVGNRENSGSLKPGSKINHFKMAGVTTVVIPEAHRDELAAPWRHSGFLLAPVVTGFPVVFFNKWNKR